MGSITQFGRDDKKTNVGGSVFGGQLSKYGLGGVGASKAKAVVGLSARHGQREHGRDSRGGQRSR